MPIPFHRPASPRALMILFAVAGSTFAAPLHARQGANAMEAAVESITAESVSAHLEFLAADALRGRDTPSPGLWTAADYLQTRHRANDLEPAGEDGAYLQRYPFRLMSSDPESARVTLVADGRRVEVVVGRDAFLDGAADAPIDAPLALVPVPVSDPLESDTLAGAVAVIPLPGPWSQLLWRRALDQAQVARKAGAVAVIHVLDEEFELDMIPQLSDALAEPAWRLGGDAFLPRLFVRGEILDRALEGARLEADVSPRVLEAGEPPNVLARIPGSDPALRDEYVVLSAHYDHMGVGQPVDGDSIYNGADDNGSGTSALLEIARVLAGLPEGARPRRTVVFAHVSGEEKGLLGSEWWVDHPTVPIEGVVANLNVDMIGGRTHPDTVAALGREYSSLGATIERVVAAHPELEITPVGDLWPEERLFFRSDQYNFMREGIPSLFFFAGFHDCYHRPCDEVGFPDPEKIARVSRLLAYTVMEIANTEEPPSWNPGAWEEVQETIAGG